jgi:hypothetical protein
MDRLFDSYLSVFNRQESEVVAMRNAMKYTQIFAGIVVVPAVGFGGSCVLATCFGDEKTLSAALLIAGQF